MENSERSHQDPAWRILVVDDLPVWANTMRRFAAYFGCQIRHATNLSAAVYELARWQPHLIILDLHMPRDPWEPIPRLRDKYRPDQKTLAFCRQITTHPELSRVIVAMVSVEQQPEQQRLTWQAGAHYFFTKGEFTVDHFQDLLHRVQAANTLTPT